MPAFSFALIFKTADGYADESGSTAKVVIRAEKFKGWFDDQGQPAPVLRWLHSKKRNRLGESQLSGPTAVDRVP